MMLALLIALALAVMLLPMLPALREWRRPSDVQPLVIDEADALDPPFLARSFWTQLAQALRAGASQLGTSELVRVPAGQGDNTLVPSADEQAAGASHRLWYADGDARLPDGIAFRAEVAAAGVLATAPHGVYRALWAGNKLLLASHSAVLRWAHGREVFVGPDCELSGRVTAERRLALSASVGFTLLHAPRVLFLPWAPVPAATPAPAVHMDLPGVSWDAERLRALADGALAVAAGTAWRGDLVCMGDLVLGPRCVVEGSLKARGQLTLGQGCHVSGSVLADQALRLAANCRVRGVVLSATRVELGSGCVIGAPGALVTVTAPQIEVAAGVEVHGALWATERGRSVVGADTDADADAEVCA